MKRPAIPNLLDYLARELDRFGMVAKGVGAADRAEPDFRHEQRARRCRRNAIDPDNRLLWRAHRRRLEPEALRDAMLIAAGQLDLCRMDSTVSYLGDQATAVGENKCAGAPIFLVAASTCR